MDAAMIYNLQCYYIFVSLYDVVFYTNVI